MITPSRQFSHQHQSYGKVSVELNSPAPSHQCVIPLSMGVGRTGAGLRLTPGIHFPPVPSSVFRDPHLRPGPPEYKADRLEVFPSLLSDVRNRHLTRFSNSVSI